MSETSKSRHLTAQYCQGNGVDLGSGGDPVVPWAIQFDAGRQMHLSNKPVQWVGNVFESLPFKDRTLDFLFSSHCIEDAALEDWPRILREWKRVILPLGYLILQAPDHRRFRKVVAAGQSDNLTHKHEPALGELTAQVKAIGGFNVLYEKFVPENDYNLLLVAQKLE